MISTQMARVNAAIGALQSPDSFLSPRQLELYKFIQNHQDLNWPNLITSSAFNASWDKAVSLLNNQISRR
jgi:hypothetical protein